MSLLGWTLLVLIGLFAAYVVQGLHLAWVLRWEDERTNGLNYYGLPLAERQRYKRRLDRHARLLAPILWLSGRTTRMNLAKARIQHNGVSGPGGSCSAETFARAAAYVPRPEDVFVVTQMKCGTTWMQHVVFQILHRGQGDLVETGREMYAVSPWLEGRKSVSIEDSAPLGVERPSRIIKTHLPASLCPFSAEAKYIYVARHPISCFASCIDFVVTNVGGMAPDPASFERWYTSADLMWWGTWTDHVRGWWDLATRERNVLFVYFEDMKTDLASIVREVAAFLGVAPLTGEEVAKVVHTCGFKYMQDHQDNFEMHPPHLLQSNAELFVSGSAERHKDVPAEVRFRVAAWVVSDMATSTFPLAERYPDVVKAAREAGRQGREPAARLPPGRASSPASR